ncbi:hypothetical protein QPK31_19275 [Massilia sp. YIM B02769]|uniref:hypothetical protein n=1 Tax=Massilia sp. YIM B02769 TaxID=3050129 RepID=UPI0025B63B45|nr:hypothetical protein [Massilia sp. YIM B02769]MDN4060354.1 hypothetical protein [Massilia sp. YIM B02769]
MVITATSKTAALGGIWSSIGLTLFEAWSEQATFGSVSASNLASLTSAALFLFLPVFFLVIGQNTGALSRSWVLDADARAEYWIVVKRMFVWFVSAGMSWLVVSAFA